MLKEQLNNLETLGPIGIKIRTQMEMLFDKLSNKTNGNRKPDVITLINNHKIVQDIFGTVTKALKVSKAEVLGHSRHQYLVIPRSMIANLIRECTTLSYPEVARTLNRDHTSILHYIKTRLTQTTFWKTHPYYNQQYNVLKKEILDGNKQ